MACFPPLFTTSGFLSLESPPLLLRPLPFRLPLTLRLFGSFLFDLSRAPPPSFFFPCGICQHPSHQMLPRPSRQTSPALPTILPDISLPTSTLGPPFVSLYPPPYDKVVPTRLTPLRSSLFHSWPRWSHWRPFSQTSPLPRYALRGPCRILLRRFPSHFPNPAPWLLAARPIPGE